MVKKSSKKKSGGSTASENSKLAAILQYFFPIGFIWWLVDEKIKKDSFVTYHLKQVLVLVAIMVILRIIYFIIPLFWFIGWIFDLAIIVLGIMGLINAVKGEEKEIPIVGRFASHFKF